MKAKTRTHLNDHVSWINVYNFFESYTCHKLYLFLLVSVCK
jgi:hypothetical protein